MRLLYLVAFLGLLAFVRSGCPETCHGNGQCNATTNCICDEGAYPACSCANSFGRVMLYDSPCRLRVEVASLGAEIIGACKRLQEAALIPAEMSAPFCLASSNPLCGFDFGGTDEWYACAKYMLPGFEAYMGTGAEKETGVTFNIPLTGSQYEVITWFEMNCTGDKTLEIGDWINVLASAKDDADCPTPGAGWTNVSLRVQREVQECAGVVKGTEGICNGHGTCTWDEECTCHPGYPGTAANNCRGWMCGTKYEGESDVCSNHGTCADIDTCECTPPWGADDCHFEVKCGGIAANDPTVCGSGAEGNCTYAGFVDGVEVAVCTEAVSGAVSVTFAFGLLLSLFGLFLF